MPGCFRRTRLRRMLHARPARGRGLGLVEALIAATILGFCLVPILNLSSQNVSRAQDDRARAVACLLATNALTRLAQRGPELRELLRTNTGDPQCADSFFPGSDTLCSGDLLASADANQKVGSDFLRDVIKAHQISVTLLLPPRQSGGAGTDLVVSRASWTSIVNNVKLSEKVYFARLLIDDTF